MIVLFTCRRTISATHFALSTTFSFLFFLPACTFIGDAQPGARNDKAICKICPSVASLRQDKSLQWELETPGGNVLNMTGAYVLVDGGYVKYAQLIG
ncbi:hypothetical protein RI054_30g120670 [Pseudoscourfieldia marina]